MKSSSEQLPATGRRRSIDQSKIAYQKPQPAGLVLDVFVGSALELDGETRLVRIKSAGHIPMENDPKAVAGALTDFFAAERR